MGGGGSGSGGTEGAGLTPPGATPICLVVLGVARRALVVALAPLELAATVRERVLELVLHGVRVDAVVEDSLDRLEELRLLLRQQLVVPKLGEHGAEVLVVGEVRDGAGPTHELECLARERELHRLQVLQLLLLLLLLERLACGLFLGPALAVLLRLALGLELLPQLQPLRLEPLGLVHADDDLELADVGRELVEIVRTLLVQLDHVVQVVVRLLAVTAEVVDVAQLADELVRLVVEPRQLLLRIRSNFVDESDRRGLAVTHRDRSWLLLDLGVPGSGVASPLHGEHPLLLGVWSHLAPHP